jgi:predicted alpha/beta superfamily hydrolase
MIIHSLMEVEMTEAIEDPVQGVTMNGLWKSHYFEMTAAANAECYRIFVGAPNPPFFGDAPGPDARYPVILVLDAKLNFAMVHAQVQTMSALGQLPPAYVVGIGYAGDESFFEKDAFRRQADLTPSRGGDREALLASSNRGGDIVHGGAGRFAAFLRGELLPLLRDSHPILADDVTILGNSLGGLFPSWMLFHEPGAFRRYVIVSPSLWWNNYEVWSWEEAHAARHDDLSANVFITFGGLETAAHHRATVERAIAAATGDLRKTLEATLANADAAGWPLGAELIPEVEARLGQRAYPGLALTTMILPDETHESIPGAGFARGLRSVFGSWTQDRGDAAPK